MATQARHVRKFLAVKPAEQAAPAGDAMVFRCTDATPDRDGDRVFVQGLQLENYLKNPTLIWNHDTAALPIGLTSVWTEGEALFMTPLISEATQHARDTAALVKDGVLRGVSIGFLPKATRPNEFGGLDFLEAELLEISLTNVPCHQGALRAKSMDAEEAKAILEALAALSAKVDEAQKALEAKLDTLAEPKEEPAEAEKEEPAEKAEPEESEEAKSKAFFSLFQ